MLMLDHFQRKTFASDGEEGATDGDECWSLGKNNKSLEYSSACSTPDDFDKV